ncbi:MAG: preprotein translocase subunit YajC [Deltaproteobacteria bacterium]|nr:preprotein translocase subunit YajC [Deltaproteobacteria bacterium]
MAQENLGGGGGSAPGPEGGSGGAAEGAQEAVNPCGGGGSMGMIIWMVLLFALMYFMLIRPQKKQRDEHAKLIGSLKKGDRVVTSGGVLGTVVGIMDTMVQIEVADGVRIKVLKSHVTGLQAEPAAAKNE